MNSTELHHHSHSQVRLETDTPQACKFRPQVTAPLLWGRFGRNLDWWSYKTFFQADFGLFWFVLKA
jgi:hypothetical protein